MEVEEVPVQNTPEILNDVNDYIPLVRRIAFHMVKYFPSYVQVEDLIQSGMIGLLEAYSHFDPTTGARFESYAGIRIRGQIIDDIRKDDWSSRSVRRQARSIVAIRREIENKKLSPATHNEIISELGITPDEYYKIIYDESRSLLFCDNYNGKNTKGNPNDEPAYDEDELYNNINHCTETGPFNILDDIELKARIQEEIEKLSATQKTVIQLYYNEDFKLLDIGKKIGVTESRACQLKKAAIKTLTKKLSKEIENEKLVHYQAC